MYKFSFVMFIISSLGTIGNIILILLNKNDVHDYLRAFSMLLFSFTFFMLMKYYKTKDKNNKK